MGKWLICVNCGKEDVSVPGRTGTYKTMRCHDCSNGEGLASCCRKCCPTEHGTIMPPAHRLTPADEVIELRKGHWAAMLDANLGGTIAYLRFETEQARNAWVDDMPNLRVKFPAHSVPLSLLLDREAWSDKVVNLSAKRKCIVRFANH